MSEYRGLTRDEVRERVDRGDVNTVDTKSSRSLGEIVRSNVFTRINVIYFVLFLMIMGTGYFFDGLFGAIIVINSAVGMVQEIRAKRTLDRLALLNRAPARVERADGITEVDSDAIVLDDIVLIAAGDQIPVDGEIVASIGLEIDESLLTGESEPVVGEVGYHVMSGSFVAAGSAKFRATAVGEHAYASRLAKEASTFRKPSSQLREGIDKILKYITWLLIPVGGLTIFNQIVNAEQPWRDAVRGLVGALVPMIPEGLVLMTSVAMAVGVIRLGRRNCLVQDLPAIEQLARVDVVCTDKTGTLTEDGMRVRAVDDVTDGDESLVRRVLATIGGAEGKPNASMVAILEHVEGAAPLPSERNIAFSSARKWAAVRTSAHGTWVLGAPDVLLDGGPVRERSDELAAQGIRVLALAQTDEELPETGLPGGLIAHALIELDQRMRAEAPGAIAYFAEQNVDVKVVSGDNPAAVAAIARSAGVPRAATAVDARDLNVNGDRFHSTIRDNASFGRVTPSQKLAIVHTLQGDGRTVAMTGDGVNDVLALKDADVGVAMGSGSPAARAVSRIVLLDNSFATLPHVVAEGRRVIGNIERVATLFLTKTMYSILLAFMVAVTAVPFPFLPRHVTLISWLTIGVPAFFLALGPNTARAQDGFVRRVLDAAIPGGIGAAAAAYSAYLVSMSIIGDGQANKTLNSTAAFIALVIVAFSVLLTVARPYRPWKVLLVAAMVAAMTTVIVLPLGQRMFDIDISNPVLLLVAACAGAAGIVLRWLTTMALRWIYGVWARRKTNRIMARESGGA